MEKKRRHMVSVTLRVVGLEIQTTLNKIHGAGSNPAPATKVKDEHHDTKNES